MLRALPIAAVTALALSAGLADARTLHGVVFADLDGDGQQGSNEPGVGSAVVAYADFTFVVADGSGQFDLPVDDTATGDAWVRVPDGFAPGPVWQNVTSATSLAFALHPIPAATGPLTFVVASDTHITAPQPFANDLAAAAKHAVAMVPPPAFFAITGDITSGGVEEDYALLAPQLANLGVPYIPIPGNHDWYYGTSSAALWHQHYGPDNYSFDMQGVHFIVWNMSMTDAEIQMYLGQELARVDPAMTIVALSHAPPAPDTIATLRSLGVDYVLTGHTHTNRVIDHGGLVEINTEPFLMGGLDFTPAGYRVITLDSTGKLRSYHRTVVDQPFLQLVGPGPGQCVAPGGGTVIAAAEIDASALGVTVAIDGGAPTAAAPTGGWTFQAPIPPLADGVHTLLLTATAASGTTTTQTSSFAVCDMPAPPAATSDWAQVGGGADHASQATSALSPPLVPRWQQPVGGNILQAAPVIAGGMVFATATDLGDDTTGGVVAFDLATGAQVWRTPAHVRGGPAVDGNVVIVAQIDGTVLGLDRATGAQVWATPLGTGIRSEATYIDAAPAVDGGEVFIGNEHAFAALETATGAQAWLADPITKDFDFSADDAVGVGGGLVVGSFARSTGVSAWDRETGALVWNVTQDATYGVNGSPVVTADTVYVVDSADEVLALDLGSGATRWKTQLDATAIDWSYAIAGAPALSDGVLVVPTLFGDLVGVDAAKGSVLWRHHTAPSPLRTTHYRGAGMAGYEGSPVVAGGVVWAADTAGALVALDLHTGAEQWRTTLGAPVLASLAVADGWLVVATYDGTLHALSIPAPAAPESGGCCDTSGRGGRGGLLLAGVVALGLRRRRR